MRKRGQPSVRHASIRRPDRVVLIRADVAGEPRDLEPVGGAQRLDPRRVPIDRRGAPMVFAVHPPLDAVVAVPREAPAHLLRRELRQHPAEHAVFHAAVLPAPGPPRLRRARPRAMIARPEGRGNGRRSDGGCAQKLTLLILADLLGSFGLRAAFVTPRFHGVREEVSGEQDRGLRRRWPIRPWVRAVAGDKHELGQHLTPR